MPAPTHILPLRDALVGSLDQPEPTAAPAPVSRFRAFRVGDETVTKGRGLPAKIIAVGLLSDQPVVAVVHDEDFGTSGDDVLRYYEDGRFLDAPCGLDLVRIPAE